MNTFFGSSNLRLVPLDFVKFNEITPTQTLYEECKRGEDIGNVNNAEIDTLKTIKLHADPVDRAPVQVNQTE